MRAATSRRGRGGGGMPVLLLPPDYFYPKLAGWNRDGIFDAKCFPDTGGDSNSNSNVDEYGYDYGYGDYRYEYKPLYEGYGSELKMGTCKEIKRVGWEHYANGHLYTVCTEYGVTVIAVVARYHTGLPIRSTHMRCAK
jgi:hypothetical protein